ncbi:MAG: HDOD domain-containing protein [Gammaproteobacteria bacterium]
MQRALCGTWPIGAAYKDIEESCVCALLHNLGEIAVTDVLPEDYLRILESVGKDGLSHARAEQAVLGTSIGKIGQELATIWEFPAGVSNIMSPPPSALTMSVQGSHRLPDNLYTDEGDNDQSTDTLETISKLTGLNGGMVENYLNESFRQSCGLATEIRPQQKIAASGFRERRGNLTQQMGAPILQILRALTPRRRRPAQLPYKPPTPLPRAMRPKPRRELQQINRLQQTALPRASAKPLTAVNSRDSRRDGTIG